MSSIADASTAAAAVRTATIPPGGMPSSSRQADRHAREFERLAAAARNAADAYRTAGADIRRLFAHTAVDGGKGNVHAYACDAAALAFRALAAIADDGNARAGSGDAEQEFTVAVAVVRAWALAAEHAAAAAMPRNQQAGDDFAPFAWAKVADGAADTAAKWAGEWGVVLDD